VTTETIKITEKSFARAPPHPGKKGGMGLGNLLGGKLRFKAEPISHSSNPTDIIYVVAHVGWGQLQPQKAERIDSQNTSMKQRLPVSFEFV
jgi:hypothetical protein